eukprot:131850-Chlamydomonas_euryale.AAC.4
MEGCPFPCVPMTTSDSLIQTRPTCAGLANHDAVEGLPEGSVAVADLEIFPYCRCDTYRCSATPYELVFADTIVQGGETLQCFNLNLVWMLADVDCYAWQAHHDWHERPCPRHAPMSLDTCF